MKPTGAPTRNVAPAPSRGRRDGRDVRWEPHRAQRRRQLVDSTLRAVRRFGPGVGMDHIAAQAGTSKTVLYRHFGDRAGIHLAVAEAVEGLIIADLETAIGNDEPVQRRVAAMVTAFLELVRRDPDIYRFVLDRPGADADGDPVRRLIDRIGSRTTELLNEAYPPADAAASRRLDVWGHGIVGMVRAAADKWLSDGMPTSVDQLSRSVMDLITPGLTALGHGDPSNERTSR